MGYRKLRIAWSVSWALLAFLLIAMLVRSHWYLDVWGLAQSRHGITSQNGNLKILWYGPPVTTGGVQWAALRFDEHGPLRDVVNSLNANVLFAVRYEAIVVSGLILAALSLVPRRYSLRTLLIATTLVAVMLGLIVWLSPRPPVSPPIDHVDLPNF
jgi:hypothetical protein